MIVQIKKLLACSSILATLLLISCSHGQPATMHTHPAAQIAFKERLQKLQSIKQLYLQGKVGFSHHGKGGHSVIKWQQNAASYTLEIINPYNNDLLVKIICSNEDCQAYDYAKHVTYPDARKWLAYHWGEDLPLPAVKYWL